MTNSTPTNKEAISLDSLIENLRIRLCPTLVGWLIKEGSFVKNWKRRYFVLRTGKLYYYKDSKKAENDYQGVFELEGAEVSYAGLRTTSKEEEDDSDDPESGESTPTKTEPNGEPRKSQNVVLRNDRDQKAPISAFQYKFQLARSGRVLVMAAVSLEVCREWMQVLKNAINVENYFGDCKRFSTDPLVGVVRVLKDHNLKELTVENETLTIGAHKALCELVARNKTLTQLVLRNAGLTDDFMPSTSNALSLNEALESVDLSKNRIGDEGVSDLVDGLYLNITLKSLSLAHNVFGDIGAVHISDVLKTNISLTTLNLENNMIGEEGCKALAKGLIGNNLLIELELGSNRIGDKGAEYLANGLKQNKTLQKLGLANNNIGSNGLQILCNGISHNKSLREVDLQGNIFDKRGAKAIVDVLKDHKTLTKVDVGNNEKLGNDGIPTLAEALKSRFLVSKLVMKRKQDTRPPLPSRKSKGKSIGSPSTPGTPGARKISVRSKLPGYH